MAITSHTQLFGLLGNPIGHSVSPALWNTAFEASGIDAVYLAFNVSADHLESSVHGLKAIGAGGLNVTRPHKEAAFRLCTGYHGAASAVGAVNTLWFPGGERIMGANTDADSFYELLRIEFPTVERALLLGAGGAALAVLWAFCQRAIPVVYWANRTRSRLKTCFPTGTTDVVPTPWEERSLSDAVHRADIIVNATPLGWHHDDHLDVLNEIDGARTVYIDLNYELSSRLLKAARDAGARVVDGSELLIRQGAAAYTLVTGQPAPEAVMRRAVMNLIRG